MSNIYIPTGDLWREIIECRVLRMEYEFYELTPAATQQLCHEVLHWNSMLTSEGFINKCCLFGNSHVSQARLLADLEYRIGKRQSWTYSQDSQVLCASLTSIKAMNQRKNEIRDATVLGELPLDACSKDYPEYWESLFPNGREGPELLHSNICRIFQEPRRKPIGHFAQPDVSAGIFVSPYRSNSELYHGKGSLDFSVFALGENLDQMAETFRKFLLHLSESYINLNARLCLEHPKGQTYHFFFGQHSRVDYSHEDRGYEQQEWYPAYYLPNVAWFNILSPLVHTHVPKLLGSRQEGISILALQHGGVSVSVQKPILEYDIPDALLLKELLLPAFYPADSAFPIKNLFNDFVGQLHYSSHPRKQWSIIPVFPDEIKIVSTYLTFYQRTPEED